MVESVKELNDKLKNALAFSEGDMNEYFLFSEHTDCFTVKYKRWLAPSMGGLRAKDFLVNELSAQYEPYPKATFIVPKGRKAEASPTISKLGSEEKGTFSQGEPQPATVKLSQLQYGVFSPRKANKKWIEHLKEAIETEGAEAFVLPKVRAHPRNHVMKEPRYQIVDGEHFCRALEELGIETVKVEVRQLSDEEADVLAMRLNQVHGKPLEPIEEAHHLKKIMEKYELSQEQVGKKFLRSRRWVGQRLALLEVSEESGTRVPSVTHAREIVTVPEEERGPVVEKVAKEEIPTRATAELVERVKEGEKQVLTIPYSGKPETCFVCGLGTYFPKIVEGKPVCSTCALDPDLASKLKEPKPSPPPTKVEKKEFKAKLMWEDRARKMHPKVSKMEDAVSFALTEKGVLFEQQREFCVRSTTPDFFFPGANLVVYLDGAEAHKNREQKDSFLREMLTKRYGLRVLGLTYSDNSQKTRDEIIGKILAEVAPK